MTAEKDLNTLLKNISPELMSAEYVFCSVSTPADFDYSAINPLATFVEKEGVSLVLLKQTAVAQNLPFSETLACITLNVHSSLQAVGFTAAVANKLAEHNISANVIAAYYHDHVFVPVSSASRAIEVLSEFQQ